MNQVILQRYISITKVAAHCSNELSRSRKHYIVTKMQNDIDTIHKPPFCCKLTSPRNFKGIYGGCQKNPVRNRRGSHSLRSDAVQTARTILAPACAFVVGIVTAMPVLFRRLGLEVKSKMKLICYRKDEASSIFWLLQQEDKKQVWKPDAEMTRHAEWVALSSRISIPNDFVLGEVIISRSTGTSPHSPKSPSLDLTLHPSSKKAKPAPKFATKLEGGWSLLADKAAEAPSPPHSQTQSTSPPPSPPKSVSSPKSPSKASKSLSLTLDDDAYDSTPPLPNLGDAFPFQFWDEKGAAVNSCDGDTIFSKNSGGHKTMGVFLSHMSWRQKKLPTGALLWPERCYAVTIEAEPIVVVGPYGDLGKVSKMKLASVLIKNRKLLVLRWVKNFPTPYQLCLMKFSLLDCEQPFDPIEDNEWDAKFLSYMTPYASDLPAKDLVKLFEMQSQEQQKKEREAKEKKALRVKRVAEKAKEKLPAMKDVSEGFEEDRQSDESDAEGEKKNKTEGKEEEDVKRVVKESPKKRHGQEGHLLTNPRRRSSWLESGRSGRIEPIVIVDSARRRGARPAAAHLSRKPLLAQPAAAQRTESAASQSDLSTVATNAAACVAGGGPPQHHMQQPTYGSYGQPPPPPAGYYPPQGAQVQLGHSGYVPYYIHMQAMLELDQARERASIMNRYR
eukprot:g6086.t1